MLRKLILILSMAMCTALPAVSQKFAYHPIFALSSGLGFSNKMANETSFMLRNEFASKDLDFGTICPVIGLGYTSRSHHLEYSVDGMDPFSGPVYRRYLAVEVSVLFRFSAWRRVRKTVIPYAGMNSFLFIPGKNVSAEEKAFFSHTGFAYNRHDTHIFSLETGVELVRKGWPKVNVSIMWELPGTPTQTRIWSEKTGDTMEGTDMNYFSCSLYCPRLVVGLRL